MAGTEPFHFRYSLGAAIDLYLRSACGAGKAFSEPHAGRAGRDGGRMEDERNLARSPRDGRLRWGWLTEIRCRPTDSGPTSWVPQAHAWERIWRSQVGSTSYFANPEVFVKPDPYVLGNAPRATGLCDRQNLYLQHVGGEGVFVGKIREGMNFELRLEAENAFNHPVFGTPNTSVDDPNFGISVTHPTAPGRCN